MKGPLLFLILLICANCSTFAFDRTQLTEKVGERIVECELAVGDARELHVVAAPDIDGDAPGVASPVDPQKTAEIAGLGVAVNANAFHKVDRNDRQWSKGGPAIPYGEVVTNGIAIKGCEQKRLMFWVDSTNACHIGRNPDFSTVREAVSDWGGYFYKDGIVSPNSDTNLYPRSIIGHDASHRKVYLLVGEMSFLEASTILHRHGASDAMNMDGGGSAVMVPAKQEGYRRPVAVIIGFK